MGNRYLFPAVFLLCALAIIFLCAVYLCDEASAEEATAPPPTMAAEVDHTASATQPTTERWFSLTLPPNWSVGYSNGSDLRAFGPSGTDFWMRLTPDGQRVIWVLNYYVRTDDGRVVPRQRVVEAPLARRAEEPQLRLFEPIPDDASDDGCGQGFMVEVNWPFADADTLLEAQRRLQWLTDALRLDEERQAAEIDEQQPE
jgi:hypothetical protein